MKKKLYFRLLRYMALFLRFFRSLTIFFKSMSKRNKENSLILRECMSSINDDLTNETGSWKNNRIELRKVVSCKDPMRFLEWNVIKRTMFFTPPAEVYTRVKNNRRLYNAIKEQNVGNPLPYFLDFKSSGNLIWHAYHVLNIISNIDNIDLVVEFGGGYGSMCRLFRNLGYNKKYAIYDIPEFICIQKYFLNSNFWTLKDTVFFSDVDTFKVFFEDKKNKKVLFISTWAISESPVSLRKKFFDVLDKNINYYLLAYQDSFDSIDNNNFFNNFRKIYTDIDWINKEISFIKGHHYLIGNKKDS